MRRLKNGIRSLPRSANWKIGASCRKKSRFSGKKSGKRVRLMRRWSTSVSAKSVLMVRAAPSPDVSR
jgi:hypothetical protein